MSADLVTRTIGVLACATTLSLLSTIVAFAAVNVAPLKWDGSMCKANGCASTIALLNGARANQRVVRLASHAS